MLSHPLPIEKESSMQIIKASPPRQEQLTMGERQNPTHTNPEQVQLGVNQIKGHPEKGKEPADGK